MTQIPSANQSACKFHGVVAGGSFMGWWLCHLWQFKLCNPLNPFKHYSFKSGGFFEVEVVQELLEMWLVDRIVSTATA